MSFFRNNHEARKSKKAFRATEATVKGHQSAMQAIHVAEGGGPAGGYKNGRSGGDSYHAAERFSDNSGTYTRGGGHVKVIKKEDK